MGNHKGSLIVLTGPSGVGKGTVLTKLRELGQDFYFSVSATTRAPRAGEIPGVSYFFLDNPAFEGMIQNGELLEYAGYADHYYGTPKAPALEQLESGRDVILEIEVQGALQVKAAFPDAVLVFLLPPSMEELERRLRGRKTESEEVIQKRIRAAAGECAQADRFNYHIISQQPEQSARELQAIMIAERCRTR